MPLGAIKCVGLYLPKMIGSRIIMLFKLRFYGFLSPTSVTASTCLFPQDQSLF